MDIATHKLITDLCKRIVTPDGVKYYLERKHNIKIGLIEIKKLKAEILDQEIREHLLDPYDDEDRQFYLDAKKCNRRFLNALFGEATRCNILLPGFEPDQQNSFYLGL